MSYAIPNTNPNLMRAGAIISGSLALAALGVISASQQASAHGNEVTLEISGNQRCVISNGLPDHGTGQFPNKGNPNRISEQDVKLCVPLNPKRTGKAQPIRGSIGFALNGVQFRPGTADYYDASSPRGFSRDRSSGWNLEGLGARELLGMDKNNAHVDHSGLYHYHGVSSALTGTGENSLVGYAADGFEIHYVGGSQTSSYQLKSGTRPSGPGGTHDGTYVEDWTYVAGSGSLDACNAGTLDGKLVYYATDTFPFFPRCLWGTPSSDFRQGPPQPDLARLDDKGSTTGPEQRRRKGQARKGDRGHHMGRGGQNEQRRGRNGGRRGPPAEAVNACANVSQGQACNFEAPGRNKQVSGTCRMTREDVAACVPEGRRAGRRP